LTLYYFHGQYAIPIHLGPYETYNLDMASLVHSRVPDPSGALIPSNIVMGSAVLSGKGREADTISVAVSASVFNVRSATCGGQCVTCNGATEVAFDPGSYAEAIGGTAQAQAQVTWNSGNVYTNPSGANFSIGNSSIATIGSTGMITGLAPGETSASFALDDYPIYAVDCSDYEPCPFANPGGGASDDVQVPSQIFVSNDVTATVNCPLTSVARTITYLIEDSTGAPMDTTVSIRENVPVTTSSCNNNLVNTGTTCLSNYSYAPGTLNSFNDYLWAGCPSSASVEPCGFTFTNQQWQYCPASGSPTSIGTVGPVNAGNAIISVHGNTTSLEGTTFGP
jgi:hypothetical protein